MKTTSHLRTAMKATLIAAGLFVSQFANAYSMTCQDWRFIPRTTVSVTIGNGHQGVFSIEYRERQGVPAVGASPVKGEAILFSHDQNLNVYQLTPYDGSPGGFLLVDPQGVGNHLVFQGRGIGLRSCL